MFSDWENFYLIVGSGGGALIGVMFVVATLTAGLEENRASRGARIYITPIVFHFAIVLVVSAIAVHPAWHSKRGALSPPSARRWGLFTRP
jgi:hypothetical protein